MTSISPGLVSVSDSRATRVAGDLGLGSRTPIIPEGVSAEALVTGEILVSGYGLGPRTIRRQAIMPAFSTTFQPQPKETRARAVSLPEAFSTT